MSVISPPQPVPVPFERVAPPAATPPPCSCTTAAQGGLELIALRSGTLEATFVPAAGMACCSLRDDGEELLWDRHGLGACAARGSSLGMSLLHPWADRLSAWRYSVGGTTVRLPVSPLLRTDRWGLPLNGVQSSGHAWSVDDSGADSRCAWVEATLRFDRDPRQLALFPFPHQLRLTAEVRGRSLEVATVVEATGGVSVPVCFGYRFYLRRRRGEAIELALPARRRIETDARLLPTGPVAACASQRMRLEPDDARDELFALGADRTVAVEVGARRLALDSAIGFSHAQARTITGEPHVLVEAATAAPDALRRGGFPVAEPDRPFHARLRLSCEAAV